MSDQLSNSGRDHGSLVTFYPAVHPSKCRAVVLLVHGLNLKPEKMAALISHLNAVDVSCYNVTLGGHNCKGSGPAAETARLRSFKQVSHQTWKNEIHKALVDADLVGGKSITGVPLVFLGFSLGGLLGVDLLISDPSIAFDKMVLLSPALVIRPINYAIQLLWFASGWVIPSLSLPSYRCNSGTPVAAYNALFEGLRHFHHHLKTDRLNIPTLVFIDPKDEFVSFIGLKKFIAKAGLDQWSLHPVVKTNPDLQGNRHHLIIDPDSVGKQAWSQMMATIVDHIFLDS